MKLLFASDIHGSPESWEQLERQIAHIKPDNLILLGDVLYHGPRNALRNDYEPPKVVSQLNARKHQIIAIRGNCDSEVDQMLLEFPIMAEYSQILADGRLFFLTHGHHWDPRHLPPLPDGSVFCYGHTHIPQLEKLPDGTVAFNPGSISLPKGGHPASFGLYTENVLTVNRLDDGEVMLKLELV